MGKVVEFFGIPGCGKSTLANSVCEEFIRRDYKVCSDDIIFNKEKKTRIVNLLISLFNIHCIEFNIKMLKILLKSLIIRPDFAKIYRCLKLIKLNGQINRNKDKYECIILSEGYIQIFLSIFDGEKLTLELIKEFKNILPNREWFVFRICINEKEASKRIEKRKHENDSWADLTETERVTKMEEREYNNKLINKNICCYMIDGIDNIIKNTDKVLGEILFYNNAHEKE